MSDDSEILKYVAQILLKKKNCCEYLSALGSAIPVKPRGGLKKLFLRHKEQFSLDARYISSFFLIDHRCSRSCVVCRRTAVTHRNNVSREDGTCIVQIRNPASFDVNPNTLINFIDYNILERNLVLFMRDHEIKSDQPLSMPSLGEYCKFVLGIDMKHKLFKFLSERDHLFSMPDTGRQHVFLAPGACEKLGIQGEDVLPRFPERIPEFDDTPHSMNESFRQQMDDISLEIHEIISRAGGIILIADIEQEMKTMKAAVINASGIDEGGWHVGSITYKYPHIFRRLGRYLALVKYLKPRDHDSGARLKPSLSLAMASLDLDDFPPLNSLGDDSNP